MSKSTENLSEQQLLLLLKEYLSYNPETGMIIRIKIPKMDYVSKISDIINTKNEKGYIKFRFFGKFYKGHHVAWLLTYGYKPIGIDHKNGIKDDNRLLNLRLCTQKQNNENIRKAKIRNKCGFLGVRSFGGKFQARIRTNGKLISLGYYSTAKLAHEAYLKAKRAHHEFCTI